MDGNAWQKLRLFLEVPTKKKEKHVPPERQAALAMTSNEDARRMVWQVLDAPSSPRGRAFLKHLQSMGWRTGKVGIYDLLWNENEWRLLSAPHGQGVGRSIQAIFSYFEPVSNEAQKLYGWRRRADTDEPSAEFVQWARGSMNNHMRFANALPQHVDVRLEPVSVMGSKDGSARARKPSTNEIPLPRLTFERDGSFELTSRGEVVARGRLTIDTGRVAFDDDQVDPDDPDWMSAGTPFRGRGFRRGVGWVGGSVKGDGSLSRALEKMWRAEVPGKTRGGSRSIWAEDDRIIVASSTTSPGESDTPHAQLRGIPDHDAMVAQWRVNQTPVPPGVWKVDELRKILRMIERGTGTRL